MPPKTQLPAPVVMSGTETQGSRADPTRRMRGVVPRQAGRMPIAIECALAAAGTVRQPGVSQSRMLESTPARTHVGRQALRALMAGRGSVLAAFESALYLEGAGGIACLLPRSAPRGPLNAVVDGFKPGTPELHGRGWRLHGTVLAIDGFGTFAVSPCDEWTPPRLPAPSRATVLAGLALMRSALAARAPRGELVVHALGRRPHPCSVDEFTGNDCKKPMDSRVRGNDGTSVSAVIPANAGIHAALADHECRRPEQPTIEPPSPASRSDALGLHFARKLPALACWLDDAFRGRGRTDPGPVIDLLGAGRGLTPSGDDCIVGLLVALHVLGACDVAATIACVVARHAPHRTSRLSAAHLDAACAGEAIEPLHGAIAAIAAGTSPEPALDALERFGHGSGFDALAGVLLAADAIAHNRVFTRYFRRPAPSGTDGTRTPARCP